MSTDGLVRAYRTDTGEKVRIPPHWLDHPILSKPFRKTPKARAAEQRQGSPAPAPTTRRRRGRTSTPQPTTETPAAGAKE